MRYLVEMYLPGPSHGSLRSHLASATSAARAMGDEGTPIDCLGALLLPRDETCFLRYEAQSPSAVEEAVRRAEVGFERVIEVRELAAFEDATTTRGGPDARS